MDIQTLTSFLGWCTIINGGLFALIAFFMMLAPDFVYKIQSKFFKLERDYFDKVIYAFLAAWKILFGFFNLVPYIALKLIS